MSPRICVSDTPTRAWLATIIALLHDIEALLSKSDITDDCVHALRRAAKQLRALSLLAPPSLAALAAETRTHADTLRRSLGTARDAAVRRETLDRLFTPEDDNAVRLRAAVVTSDEHSASSSELVGSRGQFATLADRWRVSDRHAGSSAALVEANATTYRRARKRAKAARSGDPCKMHRWRRAIVDLNLQVGVFAAIAPRLARIAKRAHGLRDLLGRFHDIDALAAFLALSSDLDPHSLTVFHKTADHERKRLERKIRRRAQRLFKMKTGQWKDRLKAMLYAAERDAEPMN